MKGALSTCGFIINVFYIILCMKSVVVCFFLDVVYNVVSNV